MPQANISSLSQIWCTNPFAPPLVFHRCSASNRPPLLCRNPKLILRLKPCSYSVLLDTFSDSLSPHNCSRNLRLRDAVLAIYHHNEGISISPNLVSTCNAIAIWSLAPCRSYGNTFHFNLQNTLQKLPNNTFEKSCAIARAVQGLDYHLKLAFKRFDDFFALKNGSRALIDFIVEDLRSMFGISSKAELYIGTQ
ncbi:hypothetical protein G4B88_001326 [Cannabis sativa]|uniref:Uncharacterized protein n=1 Tax=Cannabis sativa TaxID=3483 RepID=A0A7J6I144_CANSA|nr:hypothetical protein G4B88_001326 [Cannabis sativa]